MNFGLKVTQKSDLIKFQPKIEWEETVKNTFARNLSFFQLEFFSQRLRIRRLCKIYLVFKASLPLKIPLKKRQFLNIGPSLIKSKFRGNFFGLSNNSSKSKSIKRYKSSVLHNLWTTLMKIIVLCGSNLIKNSGVFSSYKKGGRRIGGANLDNFVH